MSNYTTDADLLALEYIVSMYESTRVREAIDDSETVFDVDDTDNLGGLVNSVDFMVIGSEHVAVTAIDNAARTITVTRGANGTSAASHSDGDSLTRYQFTSVHTRAKGIIDRQLKNASIDVDWEGIGPKVWNTDELTDLSSYMTLALIYELQSMSAGGNNSEKAEMYREKYRKEWDDLNLETVDLDDTLCILTYDGTTYTDRTAQLSVDKGAAVEIVGDASSSFFIGMATGHSSANVRVMVAGDYTGLDFSVLDGDGAEQDAQESDGTSGFTVIGNTASIGYSLDNAAPYLLTSTVRPMSRYWLKISATGVTQAAKVRLFTVEQEWTEAEPLAPGEEALVSA